jgi:RNA polymerase sigma-70 factor (ECF subfamily)
MTPQLESQLLQKAADGDTDALRALLERFGPQVWNEISHQIGPTWRASVDPDDVMQVTYLEVFLQISRLETREPAAFAAWLRRMAENNLRDAIKELDRKKRPSPARRVHAPVGEDSYVALVEMLGATSGTPSRQAAGAEICGIMEDMLERLPPDYRSVIRLYDLEGLEIADVAKKLGRSAGAIHMLRARAHDRLRDLLGSETNFFSRPA